MREEWNKIEFGTISDFKNGINFEKNQKGEIGIPTIDVKNMYTDSCYVNTADIYSVNKKIPQDYYLQNDDLLFVRSSLKEEGVGWTSLYKGEPNKITYCGFIIRARLFDEFKNKFDSKFLTYFFRTDLTRKELVSGSGRVAITNINQGLLSQIKIPVPSLPEQRKIAYVLSTVQKAIEQQDKLIRHTTELKKALMQKLFTEGAKGEKQKQTEIGLVPESWDVVELSEVCDRVSVNVQPNPNGEKPYVGLEHIVPGQIYLTSWGTESDVVSSKAQFRKGEILYGKLRPYLDKAALAHFDGMSSTDILIFTGKDDVQNEFLIHFFHTERLIDYAKSTTTGVQHPRTSWSTLKKLKLGLPSKTERKLIAQTLNLFEDKLSSLQKKKQTLTDLFKTLLHELMTGERRVHEIEFEALTKEYKIEEQPLSMAAEK